MKIIGLTGSIATGKSYLADIFRKNKVDVFNSDKEVGIILQQQNVVESIKKSRNISSSINNDKIDKEKLSKLVFTEKHCLDALEEIIHPIISIKIKEYINSAKKDLLLEIPLLFEKSYNRLCDKVITTYCSHKTQVERALRRKNLDKQRLDFILNRQMSSSKKVYLSDYAVNTDISYVFTDLQIHQIIKKEEII